MAPVEEEVDEAAAVMFGEVNLVKLAAKTPKAYGRLVVSELFTPDEISKCMLSPDKKRSAARPDLSPKRKELFKGEFDPIVL